MRRKGCFGPDAIRIIRFANDAGAEQEDKKGKYER